MPRQNALLWIDLEMTGLDPEKDRIIEMAAIVTDADLNSLAESPVITVHQPDSLLAQMDEWCTRQHGQSGLTARGARMSCYRGRSGAADAGIRAPVY